LPREQNLTKPRGAKRGQIQREGDRLGNSFNPERGLGGTENVCEGRGEVRQRGGSGRVPPVNHGSGKKHFIETHWGKGLPKGEGPVLTNKIPPRQTKTKRKMWNGGLEKNLPQKTRGFGNRKNSREGATGKWWEGEPAGKDRAPKKFRPQTPSRGGPHGGGGKKIIWGLLRGSVIASPGGGELASKNTLGLYYFCQKKPLKVFEIHLTPRFGKFPPKPTIWKIPKSNPPPRFGNPPTPPDLKNPPTPRFEKLFPPLRY